MIRYWYFLCTVLLCAVPGGPAARVMAAEGVILGVGTHLSGGKRDIISRLDLLQAAGVKSIRDDAAWALVEQKKGELKIPAHWDVLVDEAARRGIEVLWILDYGNRFYDGGGKPFSDDGRNAFARYAAFVVEHFKGRVSC